MSMICRVRFEQVAAFGRAVALSDARDLVLLGKLNQTAADLVAFSKD